MINAMNHSLYPLLFHQVLRELRQRNINEKSTKHIEEMKVRCKSSHSSHKLKSILCNRTFLLRPLHSRTGTPTRTKCDLACVASISNRVIARKLERKHFFFFCSCPSFLDEPREETLVAQAKCDSKFWHVLSKNSYPGKLHFCFLHRKSWHYYFQWARLSPLPILN